MAADSIALALQERCKRHAVRAESITVAFFVQSPGGASG